MTRADAPAPPAKPVYTHGVVDRVVPATREQVWPRIVEWATARGLDGGAALGPGAVRRVPFGESELVETFLSVEPPWRLVYEITDGAPVALFQGFVHVVPHPDGCRVIRSFLVDPGPAEESAPGASAEFVAAAQTVLDRWADDLVTALPEPAPPVRQANATRP